MGANQSARKITVVNDEATGVIKISDSVVQRLKGEFQPKLNSFSELFAVEFPLLSSYLPYSVRDPVGSTKIGSQGSVPIRNENFAS